jgi:hypothetical protein
MELRNFPAGIDDFTERPGRRAAFAEGWDAILASWFEAYAGIEGGRFYDPRADTTPGRPDTQAVAWDAFPRPIETWFEEAEEPDLERWRAAETLRPRLFDGRPLRRVTDGSLAEPVPVFHRQQDEYCEWFAHRDDAGHIARVTFTCEGPEYWRFLAGGTGAFFPAGDERAGIVDGDLDLVTALYRRHIDPSVADDDLLWPYDVAAYDQQSGTWGIYGEAGSYNPFNRWNTTAGAMHLTHPANTLRGVFTVVGRAAVLRKDSRGRPIDDAEALVCCSGFGEPNRSSDPSIGAGVNGLIADGLSVSLADPLGLYMAGINAGAFQGPAGEDMTSAWQVDRGDAGRQRILRATFAAPAGLTVDRVLAAGTPIAYGGQIADEVQMIVTALAKRIHAAPPARKRCVTKCCENPDRPGVVTVVDRGGKCSAVDWVALAPATTASADVEGPPAPPSLALAEPAEILDRWPRATTPRRR